MKFLQRKKKLQYPHYLGFRKQILTIAIKAMVDFLLRISVNSSYVLLGTYDIISEGFYKHSVFDFLDQIPKNLSYPNTFSPYLKPYISNKFNNILYKDGHELVIGSFWRYYSIRLPFLARHVRFHDWPKDVGISEGDLRQIAVYSFMQLEDFFPNAAIKLEGNGSEDTNSIFYELAVGMEMASSKNLERYKIANFLYPNEEIWAEIIEYLPKMKENSNVLSFFETVFTNYFQMFWDSYRLDYTETVLFMKEAGGFEGCKEDLSEEFWRDLEKRLERHDFILRTAEFY